MGKRAVFRIDMRYMKLTDREALKRWKETTNPDTGRSNLLIKDLALELGVCETTVYHISNRLQAQGLIKKHHSRGRSGSDIEVLSAGN